MLTERIVLNVTKEEKDSLFNRAKEESRTVKAYLLRLHQEHLARTKEGK